MTKIGIIWFFILLVIYSGISYAKPGLLFKITEAGTPGNVKITLCLNGKGPTSCQNYQLTSLNLTIKPMANHFYANAGIKVNTHGYTLSGCTLISNGFCLFAMGIDVPAYIALSSNNYQLVTVGNPNNLVDPATGLGAVSYVYRIGKYPVTIGEYTTFLNAVAKFDTYSLYTSNMKTDLNSAGIIRTGASGHYVYTVMNNNGNSANRPITYVSWFNAARYANWMSNGKPTGFEDNTTTEDGAYALHGAVSGFTIVKNTINPNTNAPPRFYLPLNDEWYKAAFYTPQTQTYYKFATQSNDNPGNTIGNIPNQINYYSVITGFSTTGTTLYHLNTVNYLTDVGAFTRSSSFYGTFDQSGNVWEWTDLNGQSSLSRGRMGGCWFSGLDPLTAYLYNIDLATSNFNCAGFRLASIA